MQTSLRIFQIGLAILCPLLGGCIQLIPQYYRVLTWNGARAEARLNKLSSGYTSLFVNPEMVGRDFTIRMPDGKVLRASEINLASVSNYTPEMLIDKYPDDRTVVRILFESPSFWGSGGGYAFDFRHGRLFSIGVAADASFPGNHGPAIGKADGSVIYAMPLSENQLIDLFGPLRRKPDVRTGL